MEWLAPEEDWIDPRQTPSMIATLNRLRRRSDADSFSRARLALYAVYALPGLLLAAFLVSLLTRRPDQDLAALDGWLQGSIEFSATVLCFAAAARRRRGRAIPLVLGAALLAWTLGDITLALQTAGGAVAPAPSLADAFDLAFYPLTY